MKLCEMSSIFSSVAFLLFSSGRTFSTVVVTLLYFFMLSVSCYLHYMCLCVKFSLWLFPLNTNYQSSLVEIRLVMRHWNRLL